MIPEDEAEFAVSEGGRARIALLATSSNACPAVVSWVIWHLITWQAISAAPTCFESSSIELSVIL